MTAPALDRQRVARPVSVGVTGAHSTGKSTFLAQLAYRLRLYSDLEVATVADLGEQCLRAGLPILHSHTYASTLWIMARGISMEVETWPHVDVLLVDRPVPDALAYLLAALEYRGEPDDPAVVGPLRALAVQHSVHYDRILRTVIDPALPLGESRDRDGRFRRLADHHVGAVLTDLQIPFEVLPADGHSTCLDAAEAFVHDAVNEYGPDEQA